MGKYRPPSEKSKYYIPKEDYLTAVHYALRYPLWQQDLRDMANTSKGISYDKDKGSFCITDADTDANVRSKANFIVIKQMTKS